MSIDPDEPQQTQSFVPERRATSFMAYDTAEREATSFSFGKGKADWGPLTIYVVMKSGDIYARCPYLPKNAFVFHVTINPPSTLTSPQICTDNICSFVRMFHFRQGGVP